MQLSISALGWALLLSPLAAAKGINNNQCAGQDQSLQRLQHDINDPAKFCKFWQNSNKKRGNSPFTDLHAPAVSSVCSCVVATPSVIIDRPVPTIAPGSVLECSPGNAVVLAFKESVADPQSFCAFWNKATRLRSPFKHIAAASVDRLCRCASSAWEPCTTTSSSVYTTTTTSPVPASSTTSSFVTTYVSSSSTGASTPSTSPLSVTTTTSPAVTTTTTLELTTMTTTTTPSLTTTTTPELTTTTTPKLTTTTTAASTTTTFAKCGDFTEVPAFDDCYPRPTGYFDSLKVPSQEERNGFCQVECFFTDGCEFVFVGSETDGNTCFFFDSVPATGECQSNPFYSATGFQQVCGSSSSTTSSASPSITTTTVPPSTTTTPVTTTTTSSCAAYTEISAYDGCYPAPSGYYSYVSIPSGALTDTFCQSQCSANATCNFVLSFPAEGNYCFLYSNVPSSASCQTITEFPAHGFQKQCGAGAPSTTTTTPAPATTTTTTSTTTTSSPAPGGCTSFAQVPAFSNCYPAPDGYIDVASPGSLALVTYCEEQCTATTGCQFFLAVGNFGGKSCYLYSTTPSASSCQVVNSPIYAAYGYQCSSASTSSSSTSATSSSTSSTYTTSSTTPPSTTPASVCGYNEVTTFHNEQCDGAPSGFVAEVSVPSGDDSTAFCQQQCTDNRLCTYVFVWESSSGNYCFVYDDLPQTTRCQVSTDPTFSSAMYQFRCVTPSGSSSTTTTSSSASSSYTTTTSSSTTRTMTTTTTASTTSAAPVCTYSQNSDFTNVNCAPVPDGSYTGVSLPYGQGAAYCQQKCSADGNCNFVFLYANNNIRFCYLYSSLPSTDGCSVSSQPGFSSGLYALQCAGGGSSSTTTTTASTTTTTSSTTTTSTTPTSTPVCAYSEVTSFQNCIGQPGGYIGTAQGSQVGNPTAFCQQACTAFSGCKFVLYGQRTDAYLFCYFYSSTPSASSCVSATNFFNPHGYELDCV